MDALRRLRAGLDRDAELATEAVERWQDDFVDNPDAYGYLGGIVHDHAERQGPKETLLRVEAIRRKVIAPYLAAVDDVQESIGTLDTAKAQFSTASRARINDGGSEWDELRAREILSTAEVTLAAEVAERDAYAKVIAALASIYPEEGSNGDR